MRSFLKITAKLLLWVGGILLVFAAVMRIFFVDVAVVGHNAMAPTMEAGDTILIWRSATPDEIGEITICAHPGQPDQLVMGRVVGKPGMLLQQNRYGALEIEGSTPDVDWRGTDTFTDTLEDRTDEYKRGMEKLGNRDHWIFVRERGQFRMSPTTVGEGKIFLLADNRTHVGQDSRYFGTVDPETCQGTVFMRLLPAEDSPNDLDTGYLDIIE